jgi:hypothetical protein
LSRPLTGAFAVCPISTPLQVVSTLRIEAFNQLHRKKLTSLYARLLFAPRRALFQAGFGSTLQTRFVPLGKSFRKPWN